MRRDHDLLAMMMVSAGVKSASTSCRRAVRMIRHAISPRLAMRREAITTNPF